MFIYELISNCNGNVVGTDDMKGYKKTVQMWVQTGTIKKRGANDT